jgi:hypothetical protein
MLIPEDSQIQRINPEEINRLIEVGRILLSVLTPTELDLLISSIKKDDGIEDTELPAVSIIGNAGVT